MEPVKLRLENSTTHQGWFGKLRESLLMGKAETWAGFALFFMCSVILSVLLVFTGLSGGALFVLSVVAIPLLYAIIVYPKFGILVLLALSYLLFVLMKFGLDFPVGTLVDGLEVLLLFGLLLKIKEGKDWKVFRGPISVVILMWIGYNIVQVINPVAESRLAWLYTVRSVAMLMLVYFIFMYHIRSVSFIRLILKVWLVLSVVGALYGLKQEFIGFSASEEAWLNSDPDIASLLFIDGHWRVFSIYSDPVAFSYNMIVSSILCISLITGPGPIKKKLVLASLAALFLFSMLYSGTRSAYVLLPAALLLLSILRFNKRVMAFMVVAAALFAVLIMVPTSNPQLYRFQTAFKPSEDASFNVRKENQKRIQPYILSHPMGGGLGATGVWGQRFAPYSFLANFPPDSGYVRVAVEMGWIGLLLFCVLMFTILYTGIKNYYRIKDPELKTYCLAMVLIVFALNIGNYPQEALVQFPSNVYFYLVVALINVSMTLDKKKQQRKDGGQEEAAPVL